MLVRNVKISQQILKGTKIHFGWGCTGREGGGGGCMACLLIKSSTTPRDMETHIKKIILKSDGGDKG